MKKFIIVTGLALTTAACTSTGGGTNAATPVEPLTAQIREDVARQLSTSIIFSSLVRGNVIYYDPKIGHGGRPLFLNRETYCVTARVVPATVPKEDALGLFWAIGSRTAQFYVDNGRISIAINSPNSRNNCSIISQAESFAELERLSAKPDLTPPPPSTPNSTR
jgi:hypothetical protein